MINLSGRTIALLKGGPGNERAVSLASAESVKTALEQQGAIVVDVDVTGPDFELPHDCDVAFNVIHGTFGEDGQLQAACEQKSVPYTGAGVESSRVAFDKFLSKERFVAAGVPTPRAQFYPVDGSEPLTINLPLVIKPPCEGSSVGVHIVHTQEELDAALLDARQYGDTTLVEEFIEGKELTIGILDDVALPIIHIAPVSGFYDMSNKYPWMNKGGSTNYFCPADLPEDVTRAVQAAALAAHRALGIEVYSRVDVILRADGSPFVLEANTIPGMTASSLLPKAARAAGIEFPELCARIVELSLALRA